MRGTVGQFSERRIYVVSDDEMESCPADVEILVDSGAEVHVCPPAFGGALLSTIVPGRMTVRSAGGHIIPHYSCKSITLIVANMSVEVTFEVIEVTRAILSVRMLLAQGYQVTFTEEASFIARGELRLPLERRKGVFVLKARARANSCANEKLGAMMTMERQGALQADRVAQLGKGCHHGDKDHLSLNYDSVLEY